MIHPRVCLIMDFLGIMSAHIFQSPSQLSKKLWRWTTVIYKMDTFKRGTPWKVSITVIIGVVWNMISRFMWGNARHINTLYYTGTGPMACLNLCPNLQDPSTRWVWISSQDFLSKWWGHIYDIMLVVINMFTKFVWYIPTTSDISAEELAILFYDIICNMIGIPWNLVSDCGLLFISEY